MVTPADFNKLPARVYVYNLVGELELSLANWIRRHFADDPDELIKLLSEERRQELEDEQGELIRGNADIEIVQLLYLSDLVNIVVKRESLRAELRFRGGNQAKKALGGLVDLRNRTMHLVRPLLESIPEDLVGLHERLERARDVLQRLKS